MQEQTLAGRTIAVPETRELDVFAAMLERRGATVLRCPLVAILDAPDPVPVLDWIRWFGSGACDDLILLTGEGLRRLLACVDKHEPQLRDGFLAVARVRKITRGPKPARALRELGLKPDIAAGIPTNSRRHRDTRRGATVGVGTIGVQLYGTEPNKPLMIFWKAPVRVCAQLHRTSTRTKPTKLQ